MRLEVSQTCSRSAKYLLVLYTVVSLVLTANHFYSSHGSDRSILTEDTTPIFPRADGDELVFPNADPLGDLKPPSQPDSQFPPPAAAAAAHHPLSANGQPLNQKAGSNGHSVVWTYDDEGATTQKMSESYVFSKIFSDAMSPVNLKPFYRQASEAFDNDDITMATLVTRNRFKVLSRLASHYQGPISAAIHVNDDETKEEVLAELHAAYDGNPDMQKYVDVHLVLDNFDRQFNLWRNVAKFFSRTDYIMMLDVDFHLCTNFRQRIRSDPRMMEMLATGTTALVVPAFEYVVGEDGLDWHTFPTSKDALLEEVDAGKLDMFHKSWLKGHGSTNYTKWYESSDVYKVTDYNFSYEPYIIYKKDGSPWCDERFIGYGANKAACLYEIFLSGIDYWVLPDDFLIHQTHEYPEATRRKERQYNRKLYSNFREELCLRYARVFVATGEWDSPKADNLREECQKIRGFRSAMNLPAADAQ